MHWRLPRGEFASRKGEGNREMLRALVMAGDPPPGLLAFDGDTAGDELDQGRVVEDQPVAQVAPTGLLVLLPEFLDHAGVVHRIPLGTRMSRVIDRPEAVSREMSV